MRKKLAKKMIEYRKLPVMSLMMPNPNGPKMAENFWLIAKNPKNSLSCPLGISMA